MQMAALMAGVAFGNTITGIDHSLGHSFGAMFHTHHGLSVGIFLPYSIEFQYKVTDRWKDLLPIFKVKENNQDRDQLFKEFIEKLKDFIRSVDGPTCVKEIKDLEIEKEDYLKKLDLVAQYADGDAVSLTSYRPINKELFRKIYEYAWDGQFINF